MSRFILPIAIVITVLGWATIQFWPGRRVSLPSSPVDEVVREAVGGPDDQHMAPQSLDSGPKSGTERGEILGRAATVMITNGIKHTVPLEEIFSGGPPKDGIPSIDHPRFVPIAEADRWLGDQEPGIMFSRGRTHRFYPYQILVWHEIVNDTVPAQSGAEGAGERILVTYCPLCLSGFVFDPLVGGERAQFGTSGQLWKSNLVMYDRKTESLWSQILGEAIVGEMAGTKLALLPSDLVRYGEFKRLHPSGEVLSRETGAARFYGESPYGDYFTPTALARAWARTEDSRLAAGELVYGIVIGGRAKAYPTSIVRSRSEVTDAFQSRTFVLRHERDADVVRMYEQRPGGVLERINPFSAFWFSWAAVHPDTELYQ